MCQFSHRNDTSKTKMPGIKHGAEDKQTYITNVQPRLFFKPTLGQGFHYPDPFVESRWLGDKCLRPGFQSRNPSIPHLFASSGCRFYCHIYCRFWLPFCTTSRTAPNYSGKQQIHRRDGTQELFTAEAQGRIENTKFNKIDRAIT